MSVCANNVVKNSAKNKIKLGQVLRHRAAGPTARRTPLPLVGQSGRCEKLWLSRDATQHFVEWQV
jgi:hypothetical protein